MICQSILDNGKKKSVLVDAEAGEEQGTFALYNVSALFCFDLRFKQAAVVVEHARMINSSMNSFLQ